MRLKGTMWRMAKSISVVGAVFVDGSRFLAARKREGKPLAGYWEFPGGKIEPDEAPEQALRRELNEELAVDADIGPHITTATYEYNHATIELATYSCTIVNGTPQLTDHDEIRWVTAEEARELNWAPADIPTVEILCR